MKIIRWASLFVFILSAGLAAAEDATIVKGDFGRSVAVERPFTRVVSLAPSITEDIFSIGAEDALVGTTTYCDYPPEALKKTKVGDIIRPNIELIVAQKPDLVLSAGNAQAILDKIADFHIPCLSFRSESIKDIRNDISRLGVLLGKRDKANAILKDISGVIQTTKKNIEGLEPKRAFLAFDLKPIITAGNRTLGNEILNLAGFTNIALEARSMYPTLNMEYIVQQKPEFFFYAGSGKLEETEDLRGRWSEWTSVPAVANDRIFSVSADLVSRASPRIFQGLKDLNDILMCEMKKADQEQ